MPDDSLFCRKCGARLIADTGPVPSALLTPKEAYYRRLAEVLTEAGFRTDPRLVEGSDAAESIKTVLQVGTAFTTLFAGPVGALAGLAEPAIKLIAVATSADFMSFFIRFPSLALLFNAPFFINEPLTLYCPRLTILIRCSQVIVE